MRKLVIGDLHLEDKIPGYLESQVNAVKEIFYREGCVDEVIFLGDIFHYRKPSPTVLLTAKKLFKDLESLVSSKIYIIRGNHDSETKADDGTTALSLFQSRKTKVITQIEVQGDSHFIPHYENEQTILEHLGKLSEETICYGHFGFDTCINPFGSFDFSISLDALPGLVFLGHIHKYNKVFSEDPNRGVVVLGTPYTTSFREARQDKYYATIESNGDVEIKEISFGPLYLDCTLEDLEAFRPVIEDESWFVLLKVFVDKLAFENSSKIKSDILEKFPMVKSLEISFKPTDLEESSLSEFSPEDPIFTITDDLIREYVSQSATEFSEEELFKTLEDIRNCE